MNPELAPAGSVELMAQIAQPLDDWCEFCTTKLATMRTADGVGACEGCAAEVIAALAKYEAEAREFAESAPSPNGGKRKVTPNGVKAKAKRRAKRKRTKR